MPSATYVLFRNAILAEQQVFAAMTAAFASSARTSSASAKAARKSCWHGSSQAKAAAGCRNGDASA
ncbi:MAG TPA: hypothetical protein VD863_16395 [Bradyrhizobium sp.]|nr:hypothetical protein [Bradyrhizobium sp.]